MTDLEADLKIAQARIKELEAKIPKWISVEDRLPEHGACVLCKTLYFMEVLQWDGISEVWDGKRSIYRKDYTAHWMPLPEAPKEE